MFRKSSRKAIVIPDAVTWLSISHWILKHFLVYLNNYRLSNQKKCIIYIPSCYNTIPHYYNLLIKHKKLTLIYILGSVEQWLLAYKLQGAVRAAGFLPSHEEEAAAVKMAEAAAWSRRELGCSHERPGAKKHLPGRAKFWDLNFL